VIDPGARLVATFGAGRVHRNAPLAPLTTFKVGGPADWLIEANGGDAVEQAVAIARDADLPLTFLGGGSNVLVSDAGVRGIVVRVHGGDVRAVTPSLVRADAGVTINGLVRWSITHGRAGLEAWAGTPGTVGGAIFGNAHFSGRLIGEHVDSVSVAARDGAVSDVPAGAMDFGYDRSRLRTTGEVLLSAVFRVTHGDAAAMRAIARASLAFRKRTQPLETPSAGCVFQNPERGRDVVPDGIPWSAGALVDRAGLKGASSGGARVSDAHANFIVNDGRATARDIRALIARCRDAVLERYGVELREEIVYLGEF